MTKYVASCSFGKDSLAMFHLILEHNLPLNEVIFFDTGMEFQCIYKIKEKVKEICREREIDFVELKMPYNFEYMMFEKPVKCRNCQIKKGYSWCGGSCRWGTAYKQYIIGRQTKGKKVYVGIAKDETKRIGRALSKGQILPLVDYGFTEKDALEYCRKLGYSWEEDGIDLYDILDRVSCWCCANKNKKELRAYYKFLPTYWNKLKDLQSKTDRPFQNGKSIFDFEEEFKKEEEDVSV